MKKHLQKYLCAMFAVIFALQPLPVFAEDDEGFFARNDILFYSTEDCNASAGAAGKANLIGNDDAEQIWNFLVGNDGNLKASERLSPEQAAGVMGNIKEESSYNPKAVERPGDPNSGRGIVQWTNPNGPGGRRTSLENAAKKAGVSADDLGFQLTFMFQESNSRQVTAKGFEAAGNEWQTLQKQTTIEKAALFWHNNFEVSDDDASQIKERITSAKDALASFKDKVPSGTAAASTDDGCGTFAGGNFEQTLLAYAWPDKRSMASPNAATPTDAYKNAIAKAQDSGQYIGGPPPGIDCGGFVTRLMIDSGFEPKYNYSGKLADGAGNTTVQEKWLKANWEFIGTGADVSVGGDAGDKKTLRQGDVAIDPGHTYVFAGTIKNFDSDTASASLGRRAPSAAYENPTSARFNWYRKK